MLPRLQGPGPCFLAGGEIEQGCRALLRVPGNVRRSASYLPDIFECLEGLAAIHTARRDPRGAARLYGVPEARRDLLGMPLPPVLLPAYQRDIARFMLSLKKHFSMRFGPRAVKCLSSRLYI